MYKTILVSNDLESGRKIVERLEQEGWQVRAAFWYHSEDDDRWELVIVSPDVADKGPLKLYTTLWKFLDDLAHDPQIPFEFPREDLKIVSPDSLLYKMVKQRSALRLGPVPEGPVLDAYIYKMT